MRAWHVVGEGIARNEAGAAIQCDRRGMECRCACLQAKTCVASLPRFGDDVFEYCTANPDAARGRCCAHRLYLAMRRRKLLQGSETGQFFVLPRRPECHTGGRQTGRVEGEGMLGHHFLKLSQVMRQQVRDMRSPRVIPSYFHSASLFHRACQYRSHAVWQAGRIVGTGRFRTTADCSTNCRISGLGSAAGWRWWNLSARCVIALV